MSDFLFDEFVSELDSVEVKAPGTGFEQLPEGEFNVEITQAKIKEYDDDVQISLLLVSVGGDYNGASTWVNIPVRKPSHEVVQRIGKEQFKKIMLACGFDKIKDVEDLVGGTFGIQLEYRNGKYASLKRIYKSVSKPTTRSDAAATTAESSDSGSPFDRF